MATDWTVGKSGSFDLGTASNTSLTNWAALRFNWIEEYSPSTAKHRVIITPTAKCAWSALVNTNVGKYLTGTASINGTQVFNQSYYNVSVDFYSTGTYYNFYDATDNYNVEKWTSPEFSGNSTSVVLSLYMNNQSTGYSQQSYSTTQTLTLTTINTSSFIEVTPWVHNGSSWIECEPNIYNSSWKVGTVNLQQ